MLYRVGYACVCVRVRVVMRNAPQARAPFRVQFKFTGGFIYIRFRWYLFGRRPYRSPVRGVEADEGGAFGLRCSFTLLRVIFLRSIFEDERR